MLSNAPATGPAATGQLAKDRAKILTMRASSSAPGKHPQVSGIALIPQVDEPEEISRSPDREQLLAASARASRVLLEATDVLAAMPTVLRELGEAAGVDRTALVVLEKDSAGKRWLLKSEWIAPAATGEQRNTERIAWEENAPDGACARLRSGQTVHLRQDEPGHEHISKLAFWRGKSSVIVPFLIDGAYAGAIGFDDYRAAHRFEPDVVAALEIAASLVGAALHRDRLAAAVRAERDHAAACRVAQLAKANAALRSNLEWLASATDPRGFYGHMLLETVKQFDAAAGTLITLSQADDDWCVIAHVRDGALSEAPFDTAVPHSALALQGLIQPQRQPVHWSLSQMADLAWPGMQDYHAAEGHKGIYALPLTFGERIVGVLTLAFLHRNPLSAEQEQLLAALGQQMTLAVVFKRLAMNARHLAVLAERNRIGQEIHDGLAQSFVGILMQLGAAEECQGEGPLNSVFVRIRDLAREGLSEARRSVLALQPGEARRGGLELALRQLAERSTVTNRLSCVFEGGGGDTGLAPEHEHELLRVAQEALSNAVRHAHPRNVTIALVTDSDALELCVADDGCGMQEPPEHVAQQGFGLTNMRERAQAIGGEWHLWTKPGEGTRINVRVPRARPK
jgi:signal transduction histidine kinase